MTKSQSSKEDKEALREALKFMLLLEEHGVMDSWTKEEISYFRTVLLKIKKTLKTKNYAHRSTGQRTTTGKIK